MNTTGVAALTGSVAAADGSPITTATITVVTAAGTQAARVTTGDEGTFTVDELPPGTYMVAVTAGGYMPDARTVLLDGSMLTLSRIVLAATGDGTPPVPAAQPGPVPVPRRESVPASRPGALPVPRRESVPASRPEARHVRAAPALSGSPILVEGLEKSFGPVRALRGIDLVVPEGSVLGVLGPNGAGKTTVVRILTTLLRPDRGRAVVGGYDVVRSPAAVRRVIGLAGQSAAIQEELTGRENLEIVGRLYHLGRKAARRRAEELLERFGLADAADRPAKTFSGGMQRRLDLAASLVAGPSVLFLDEPTTGLDPRSRQGMWQVIRELTASGTTLLLTTQYLEEADELANEIAVIDRGLMIASGTAESLKDRIGGDVLEFTVTDPARLPGAVAAVAGLSDAAPQVERESGRVFLPVGAGGSKVLVEAVRRLDGAGIEPSGMALRRPSLDDVFLTLTGHAAETGMPQKGRRRRGRRRGPDETGGAGS